MTDEQEGNIVSTKKELGVRPTVIPSSQEQSGTGTCYHLGQHQRRHWRDSGQTLLLPPSVQLLDCQLSMYIVLTDFKLYIYFGPLTTDPPSPAACQCRRTNYVLKRTQSFTPEEEEEKKNSASLQISTFLPFTFCGQLKFHVQFS